MDTKKIRSSPVGMSWKSIVKKTFKTLQLTGDFAQTLGQPETGGLWLIYGEEKMGKTTFALQLAQELAITKKVLYVMAEQGLDSDFVSVVKREISGGKIRMSGYIPIEVLKETLSKKRQSDVVIIDNATAYKYELKYPDLVGLLNSFKNKLFILLAHEVNGEVYTNTARMARMMAKRVIHVVGNMATVDGRSEGGAIIINRERAHLYHGTASLNSSEGGTLKSED